jgi:hypothetical protein
MPVQRNSVNANTSFDHSCHWPGCGKPVLPKLWGCRSHWFRLPRRLRDRIWAAYRVGQEVGKDPSPEYLDAAAEAQRWIAGQKP